MSTPKRTYTDAGGLAPSIPLQGIVGCHLCGLGAKIEGAERLPENTSVFCPRCAFTLGFGDGSGWVEVKRKPRKTLRSRPARRKTQPPSE